MKNVVPALIIAGLFTVLGFVLHDLKERPVQQPAQVTAASQKIVIPQLELAFGDKFKAGVPITISVEGNQSEEEQLLLVYNEDKVQVMPFLENPGTRPRVEFRSRTSKEQFYLYRVKEEGSDPTCTGCWRIVQKIEKGTRDRVVSQKDIQNEIDLL